MPTTAALVEQSFGPDQTRAMAVAFEKACESLGMTDTSELFPGTKLSDMRLAVGWVPTPTVAPPRL